MTDTTKKGVFRWTKESDKTFNKFKEIMSLCLVLALPNFGEPFILECDA